MVPESCAVYSGFQGKRCNQIPVEADHRGLVRFRDKYDMNYAAVQNRLPTFVSDAPMIIKERLKRVGGCKYLKLFTFERTLYLIALRHPGTSRD